MKTAEAIHCQSSYLGAKGLGNRLTNDKRVELFLFPDCLWPEFRRKCRIS